MTGQISIFDAGVEKPSRWHIDIDNDMQMLRCESCGCRVTRLWYDLAVGDHGFRHCPYCGKEMFNWRDLIVPWPGFKDRRTIPVSEYITALETDAHWITEYAQNKKDCQRLVEITTTMYRAAWALGELEKGARAKSHERSNQQTDITPGA